MSLLQILVELMGSQSTEKLIAKCGGTRIWVPVRSTPQAKLTQILGDRAASALCARFGGDYLQVPQARTDSDDLRRRIAELHREGYKIDSIALAVGRNRRTVFRVLKRQITEVKLPSARCHSQEGLRLRNALALIQEDRRQGKPLLKQLAGELKSRLVEEENI